MINVQLFNIMIDTIMFGWGEPRRSSGLPSFVVRIVFTSQYILYYRCLVKQERTICSRTCPCKYGTVKLSKY